jgi:hypothetical protein
MSARVSQSFSEREAELLEHALAGALRVGVLGAKSAELERLLRRVQRMRRAVAARESLAEAAQVTAQEAKAS